MTKRKHNERRAVTRNKRVFCEETGKVVFNSQAKAMNRLAYLANRPSHQIPLKECYICPFCCGWHLTSMTREQYETIQRSHKKRAG